MHTNGTVVRSEDVVGTTVRNLKGEDLGDVEAVMLDKVQGCVSYVVLSFGGFLGMGDKLFAMPWDIFTYDSSQDCFVIDVDKTKLEHSPGFDKDHWPDMSSNQWSQNIHDYYGTQPRIHNANLKPGQRL